MSAPTSSLIVFSLVSLIASAACGDDDAGRTDTTPDTPDTTETSEVGDDTETSDDAPEADTSEPDTTPADTADTSDDAPETDTAEPDTTPADTADTSGPDGDTVEPGPELAVDHFGARLWGPIVQMSQTGRTLWLGTRGVPDPIDGTLRAGLYRVDLDSGHVRHFEHELPLEDYHDLDPFIPEGTFGPTSTAGVQAFGDRFLAVAHTGLLLIDGSSVTPFPVMLDDAPLVPVQIAVAPGPDPIAWLTSDRGLVRLDGETFAVEAVVTGAELGLPGDGDGDFGKLALDPDSGAVYAAYYQATGLSHVVRVDREGAIAVLTPGSGGLPAGRVGELVWSRTRAEVYVALGAWSPSEGGLIAWSGTSAREIVREGPLAEAFSGEVGAFGAQVLALDDARARLVIGGQVQSGLGGQRGGGLVAVDLAAEPPRLVGLRSKVSPLYHWHTNHLVYDGERGRIYAAISDLCSEVKLRNRGLFALSFDETGEVRYERPLLSGVRAVALDPRAEAPWLGLRDDNTGLACDGYPIQTGLGTPQAGGSLALTPVVASSGDGGGGILVDPAVTAIDVAGLIGLGTYRDGFFLGELVGGRAEGFSANQALIGPSLFTEDVLVEPLDDGATAIWIAGRTSHSAGDPPQLADRGPRGAARIVIRDGRIEATTHYVRASEDLDDVVGLPSGDVRDLLVDPAGGVIAACATERLDLPLDRLEPEPFEVDGVPRPGGLAHIDGDRVSLVAGPETTPDPRALARDADGRLLVADAERGVLRQHADGWQALDLPGLPPGAIPQALWAGAGDDLALATSAGLWARLGGRVLVRDDVGFAWSLAFHDDRLYAGTDVGLVVVRPVTAPETTFPAPPPASDPFAR